MRLGLSAPPSAATTTFPGKEKGRGRTTAPAWLVGNRECYFLRRFRYWSTTTAATMMTPLMMFWM